MKKQLFLFILALLCVPLAHGQSFQNPLQGPITSTSAACAVAGDQSCVWQKLSATASVATVQVSGTFSATLTVEANNGGASFTTLGTITTAGMTSYVVAGFTDFRVRASAYTSGTAFTTINSSTAPSGGVTSGTADPTGNACAANALYVRTTNGALYTCNAGVFAIVGGGGGTVTSVSGTAPIASSGGNTPAISCPTCVTSAAALTANALVIGGGAQATSALGSLGTTTTLLHGNAAGAPTYGAVALATDVSGQLPIAAVGSAGLSGTAPIAIASTGAISCPTCNTSAAAITSNVLPKGSGGAQGLANSSITDNGTTVSTPEQIVSTLATGTAPFSVSSTTNVANLNASSLNGATFAAPGAIGSTTPATTLQTSGLITGGGSVTAAVGSAIGIAGRFLARSTANGIGSFNGTANSANELTQFVFGLIGNTTNPELFISGLNMDVRRGDGTTGGGTFSINGGSPIKGVLSATATLDFANQAAIGCNDLTITVTGAALGDSVQVGVPNGSVPNGTATFSGWVSATNTVTIRYCNLVSGDPASGTFRATVTQF